MSEIINWQTDPLLFDQDTKQVNDWINANDLIKQNCRKKIFLADGQTLNLFPLMVRRVHFVRSKSSDRVMARFPFLLVRFWDVSISQNGLAKKNGGPMRQL